MADTADAISLAAITSTATAQLVTSAIVYIHDYKHNLIKCRALLDTCATINLISEAIARRLKLPIEKRSSPIGAIGDMVVESKGSIQITIQSTRNEFRKSLTCLIVTTIAEWIPSEVFPRESIEIPANLKLADPEFHVPKAVDLLIGAGTTLSLFSVGQINFTRDNCELYLQKTRLGWIVAGGVPVSNATRNKYYLASLNTQITKFWEIEEIAPNKSNPTDDLECEDYFTRTTTRGSDGRYTVRLPFRGGKQDLGESRTIAIKRFMTLERKLKANATLRLEYTKVINEYRSLNHMSRIENPDDEGYYMPHHAVIKDHSNTTKVRVVFDASAKSNNGVSLNDILIVGPTVQDKLLSHLIRFRTYRYAIVADIEKMYRQVRLHEEERRFQRIIWRDNEKIETFQLNILTFGVASSPFLAIRVLQQLANDERQNYPRAAHIISNHLYVYDLLSGADTIGEARAVRDEVILLLKRGGFVIRQWASNDDRVLEDLDSDAIHANFILSTNRNLKTLGIAWNARNDTIYYTIHAIKETDKWTKRSILSEIAKIFDPLGLLGPIVLYAKRLMQDVWRRNLQWDESVPQGLHTEWSTFAEQLQTIKQISFDRRILMNDCDHVQFHGFCDASINGYGACLYVRSHKYGKTPVTRLLCAKSRVAPLKTVTIPRLELCEALLLTQLYLEVSKTWTININKTVFWCDSTIVLHWLKTPSRLLKTFVANRVAEIQKNTNANCWRHVRSEDNPADALSRGQLPRAFLQNTLWATVPSWLSEKESKWPNDVMPMAEIPELKQETCLALASKGFDAWVKFSSYSRFIRAIAHCRRLRIGNKQWGALTTLEIREAEMRILRIVQAVNFASIIDDLKRERNIKAIKISKLNPFLDDDGLTRVGGRVTKTALSFAKKHPILIPSNHKLTDLIIQEIHSKYFHPGIQTTLCLIRQKFWLTDSRNQIRKILRGCTRCFRCTAETMIYKMGNLPPDRVRQAVPFSKTGIDYCGPFFIKEKKHRNRNRIKVYICVFVCMVIKAIHLEVVSDLTSEGFLAALRRFSAKRGIPDHVYSDNGTNFIGANHQLREIYSLFNSEQHQCKI